MQEASQEATRERGSTGRTIKADWWGWNSDLSNTIGPLKGQIGPLAGEELRKMANQRCGEEDMAVEGLWLQEDQDVIGSGGSSGAGQKTKRLARAGMMRGGGSAYEGTRIGKETEESSPRTYADMLKGHGGNKEMETESYSEVGEDNGLNTALEGEVVRCEFEADHYEGVVSCFKDSTILVHFLGEATQRG